MPNNTTFRVAWTADFYQSDGSTTFKDLGLSVFDAHPHIEHFALDTFQSPIESDQIQNVNSIIALVPHVTAETLSHPEDLLAIARFGVGYDSVDVPACTDADVLLFIASGAVDRSVAEATVGWMIALTHNMCIKDNLVRTGRWDDRTKYMGKEIRDRTFGAIGLGGIAREAIRLLSIFGMKPPIAFDPYVDPKIASDLGVQLVDLNTLLQQADFVSVHCPLTDGTRDLIGESELAQMKPEAYLINTARGGIVNEEALHKTLQNNQIAGAALDCFVGEPITEPSRFADLENVILAPHSIAWTDEIFRDIGQTVCQGMVDLSQGKMPNGIVNPDVLDRPGFQAKLQRLRC